jgi:hypothetical protein
VGIRTGEVMQNLRAHYDVDTPIGERETQRVSTHGEGHRSPAGARQLEYRIQAHRREVYPFFGCEALRVGWYVAESGPDVEEGGAAWKLTDGVVELVDRRAQSTEQRVGSRYIGKRPRHHSRIDIRQIENLDAAAPRRCQNCRHQA